MRNTMILVGMIASLVLAAASDTAHAQNVYEIRAGATVGGTTYQTLEQLRQEIDNGRISFGQGDVIVLHNSDNTLTGPLILQGIADVTIRSVDGKQYAIAGPLAGFALTAQTGPLTHIPNLHLENVRVTHEDDTNLAGGLSYTNSATDRRTLTVRDSVFEGLAVPIALEGNVDATFTNTVFTDNVVGITGKTAAGETLNIGVVIDKDAPYTTRWTNGIISAGDGTNSVTVDVAKGKVFDQRAGLYVTGRFEKKGGGVYKVYGGATATDIKEGTVHFRPGTWSGQTITVRSDAVFKITFDPGTNMTEWFEDEDITLDSRVSRFDINSIQGEAGARLEIGDISKFPVIPHTWSDEKTTIRSTIFTRLIDVGKGNTTASFIPESMNIDNKLLTAKWYAVDWSNFKARGDNDDWKEALENMSDADKDSYMLHISKVNNLAVLTGVGSYADAYRHMTLTEVERDLLDSIYARGGTNGQDLGFLQTLGGHVVQNAMLALRNNQLDLLRRINRRVTSYQKEELELTPGITGSDYCFYTDDDPAINYGELWTYVDAAFDVQDDVGSIAGYDWKRYGVGVGYDWHVDQLIVGGAINYTMGDMKLRSQSSTKTDIKNVIAAVYASYASEGWFITGTGFAGYGWNRSESAWNLPGASPAVAKTGNYGTGTVGLGLEVGYMMETFFLGVPVRVTPYGGLVYSRTTRNATRERGGILNDGQTDIDMNRQFHSGTWNSWDGSLGFRLTAPIDRERYTLLPSLDVAWIRNGGDARSDTGDVSFIRDPSAKWSLPVTGPNRSALRLAAGLDARIGDRIAVGASYEFEWRKRADRHRFNVNFSMGF